MKFASKLTMNWVSVGNWIATIAVMFIAVSMSLAIICVLLSPAE
jgi:hypothetical protein